MALGPKDKSGDCPSAKICSCKAPFVLSSDLQSCLSCSDLCASDPCNSKAQANNQCKMVATQGACPTAYTCSCAQGWLTAEKAASCLDCPDPCASDPCFSGLNKDNVCNYVFRAGSKCPSTFECSCQGTGFLSTVSKKACTRTLFCHFFFFFLPSFFFRSFVHFTVDLSSCS